MSIRTHQHELDPQTVTQAAFITQRRRMEEELEGAKSKLKKGVIEGLSWRAPLLLLSIVLFIANLGHLPSARVSLIFLLVGLSWALLEGLILRTGTLALLYDWRDVRRKRDELKLWDEIVDEVSRTAPSGTNDTSEPGLTGGR